MFFNGKLLETPKHRAEDWQVLNRRMEESSASPLSDTRKLSHRRTAPGTHPKSHSRNNSPIFHPLLFLPPSLMSHDKKMHLTKPSEWAKHYLAHYRLHLWKEVLEYLLSGPGGSEFCCSFFSRLRLSNNSSSQISWTASIYLLWFSLFMLAAKSQFVTLTTRWSPVISLKTEDAQGKCILASTWTLWPLR